MANQIDSKDGIPRKDDSRPSPDVDKDAVDGQSNAKATQGDGPHKPGLRDEREPDLVAPSGVNERDHGAADDKPMGGGALNFEDGESGRPYGRNVSNSGRSGTWDAEGGDSGKLGAPAEILSDRNGPSDRGGKNGNPDGGSR